MKNKTKRYSSSQEGYVYQSHSYFKVSYKIELVSQSLKSLEESKATLVVNHSQQTYSEKQTEKISTIYILKPV